MAAPTNVYSRHSAPTATREDLQNMIYNISPMETYFMNHIGRGSAKSTLHEWQIDALAAASTANAAIEGDDFSAQAVVDTTRLKNYTQIMRKEIVVSGTLEETDNAGMASMMAYQTAKKGKELKRDIEIIALHNSGATAGAAASARTMAGAENWIYATQHIKATGQTTATTTAPASGIANNAPADGSATALVVADFSTALQVAWNNGGETDVVLVGAVLKAKIGTFTGIATRFRNVAENSQATVVNAVDVFVSDFGNHKIVLSRYVRTTSVLCLDMSLWSLNYLRPMQTKPIATTGDSTKKMLLAEVTLVAKNPLGNTKITGVS